MEPTQALNFNIPKLKRQVTKDNLFEIDLTSRDAKELLDSVSRTYLDQKYSGPWRVKSVNMVRNTELEQDYKAKRTDMKEEGRHNRELVDQIAFCAIKEPPYITKIAKNGMMTNNLPFSIIGEHKSGVCLTKHADVQLKMVETISSQTITALFVFNTMLGKCKAINERIMSSADPTPNYDSHIPLQPAQPSDTHIVQLQRSQIYLYEYDNDGMPAARPRQCLPHAVITYEKVENFTMGPLKSIYCYDPAKGSSQPKKFDDKADWKKAPRNMATPQLPFAKNTPPLDNPMHPTLPFGSLSAALGQARDILGAMTQATFNSDAPRDFEAGGPNQCGILASNLLLNYAQQMSAASTGSIDGQGVMVHRSGSDPRRRFLPDETMASADQQQQQQQQQQRIFPQTQGFPDFQRASGMGFSFLNNDQNMDSRAGAPWEPQPPLGFYSECDSTDKLSQPWHNSSYFNNNNNNNNNIGNNNNNFNNSNFYDNNNFNNNNSNNPNNNNDNNNENQCGMFGWFDPGFGSFESEEAKRQKFGNTNCDNQSSSGPSSSSSSSGGAKKKSIPFALNKKKPPTAVTPGGATPPQQQPKPKQDDPPNKTGKKDPWCADTNQKTKTKPMTSELDSKPTSAKLSESGSKIPFPKKTPVLAPTDNEAGQIEGSRSENSRKMEDLFKKLFQTECKRNFGDSLLEWNSWDNKNNSKIQEFTNQQNVDKVPPLSPSPPPPSSILADVSEMELKNFEEFLKEKIKLSKTENETPKIKTSLASLNQGLKTTILLPSKNRNEDVPQLEDLKKLLGIVESALESKTQATIPQWVESYQSFLKRVQKKELTPGQHHKWVRKKEEPPPEPPPPDKIPPPMAEVSIEDVVNARLMKELLLEQELSESTSVSEADSLYLPPSERKKRKTGGAGSSLATRRQTKKKAPFDMTSYRRRRKRQKMQRKAAAAAEFDNCSLASTTSSYGLSDNNGFGFWGADFKDFDLDPSFNDDLPLCSQETIKREATLTDLGFDDWKDALLSLKFQPVVVLKDCVRQITSHLQQEGSSNLMEWIGNPNELLETLNFPPNHSPVAHSSSSSSSSIITTSTSMSTTPSSSSSSTSITTTTTPSSTPKPGPIPKTGGTKPPTMSKSVSKTKPSKPNPIEFQPTSETISINSIKASVKSEITKGKKFSKKNLLGTCGGTGGTVSKKKVAKPKTPSMEIPRIKPKLPEKASAAKVDPSSQLFSTIFKDVRKPTPPSLAPTHPAPSTLAAKTNPSTINKTVPPRGIIKNTRGDVATPKVPIVSPASFPPTDQSLKVDLLMESISTPPTASAPTTGPPPTTGAPTAVLPSESEQKKLTAEQRKVAEQKKQKISFQAYMEKHVKTKPARSPPREKTNVFESLKDIFPGNSESPTKPVTETSGTAAGATAAAPSVSLPAAIPPILDKLKPTLLMPPVTGTFTNSVFSPISPPLQIPRDPRVPSKLPLPFVKDPPLPKIIPTAPKVAKEDLKPILKGKQPLKSPSSSVSHRKAPPLPKTIPTSITIPLEELNEPSHAPVDPRLSRKAAPTQPDLHPAKEPSSKASSITDPLLTRDPRLLKMYGEVQPDVGRSEKPPLRDALSDAFGFLKKPDLNNEGVSDIIGKSKPILKNNTWNLFSIQTGDDDDDDGTPTSQQPQGSATKKPSTKIVDLPVYAQFSTDVPKDTKPVQTSTDSRKSDQPKPDTPEVVKGRPAWGFYREMSPKMPGSEDANPTADGDLNPSETEDKKDENSASNAAGASDSPQVLYFSDSDSNSNEDLTKPLYIDESATGRTPRRDPFENYKFNLKSPEHGLKKSSSTNADPKKASNMKPESDPFNTLKDHVKRDTTGVDIYGSNFGGGSSESLDQKLSPFNETVPPADPDSKNPSSSSLFCAYQMTGKTELKDTSHIWMKSLSTLSQAKAVSSLNISDEVLNVLRKVVKENIPAGQKDGSSSKESNAKELHKPGTLSKDYKLEGLDKDLFKSTNLDLELSTAEDSTAHSESFGSNAYQQKSSKKVPEENFKSKRESSESHKGHSGAESVKAEAWDNPDHTSKMCNPSIDETSKNLPLDYPKTEDFSQGQAIPVLSGKKLGPFHKLNKKSRSLSPTVTTVSSATHYLQPNTTWLGHQTPFWTGINQKIDGVWRNLAPFNPIVTTSHPTPPIWPPPINMPPSILANIPFPVGFMPPDLPLPHPSLNQTDSFRPSNLVDWFADKINPKGDNPVPDYGSAKAHTNPHGELVTNFLDSISSTPKSDSTSEADQSSTKPATTSSSNTDKKSVQNNPDGSKIRESEGSSELTLTNSKADPERSGSSVYSSTDKTSEIASGSALPLDPSTSSGTKSIPKTSSKESAPSLKRTLSIESLSGGSQVLKGDPLKKPEKKKIKLDLSSLTTSSIREDSKSKEGDCKKSDPGNEKSEAGHNKTSGPKEPETSEERAASGESTSKRPGATNTGASGSEETKKEANGDCKKSRHRPKSLREERSRKKSGETSSGSPKSGQVSSLNSKSLNDIRLGRCNREQLKKLMKGFLKKSDLQSLLESVKKIKKELASQPSDEKERPSEKRSDRKTLASPSGSRPGSEEKSSSSRTKKSSEKISSDRLWKPVKSLEETAHSPATSSSSRKSDSARSKSSSTSKRSSSRHRRESSTKNSKNTERHVSTATSDKQKRSSEANNGDSELEEGELPDDESDGNEDPEVRDEQAKHRTSKWKTESGRRRRQQSERRHGGGSGSHDERSHKRRLRQSMSDDEEHQNQFDAYDRGDSYPYGPMDDFPRDRMEGYPHGRMDCYPMDNSDGYPGNPMDYPRGNPDECPPERMGFYPPPSHMDMDSFNPSSRPDDFMWDNQRRFQEKQERDFRGGNFSPYHAGNPGGPYWEESNNYPDSNFNDYGPDGDRYPRGRPDRFPYENPDFYRPDNCRPSLDPEDYIMDETDGLLYEKTDEFMAPPPQHPNAGYPRDWPGMNPHGKRAGSYSPGREENCYWSDLAQLRKIKIEVRNNGKQNQKGAEESVSREIFAAEDRQNEARGRPPDQSSYGDSHNRTEPKKPSMFNTEEDDKKMRDTFDTINDYLRMFVKEGSARYKILKKSLGVPLETRFDTMSKTKRKKIRKKIQSQLQALKQAAPSIGNQDRATMQETDSPRMLKSENPQFKIEDFQNFPTFEGNLNSMEHLKNWLNRPPDTDPNLHSRSSSEARDDSEDDANQTPNPSDDVKISDPNIRRAVQTVIRLEKSPGFGTPHQRVPLNLLLAEEKDNLFSFEGCFLILMRKIPRKAVERLVTLREVLNFLTCELQAAQKANDMPKYCQLRDTKNKLHDRRKDVLEKFTGTINVKRLQTIREAKMAYEDCLEYLKKKPDPPPKIDKGVVVKSIKAIQGHINMTKKFLDESSSNSSGPPLPPHSNQSLQTPPPPHMSSMGFCPDMPGPNQPPDVGWSWMGLRNLDNPIPGCYNNPPWNNPGF